MTKLVLAIINNDDSTIAASALNAEGFFVTKLSTTGGFLMVGNTTLLIGTEDGRVERIKEILSRTWHAQTAHPSSQNFGRAEILSPPTR
ncbi:MAG: cyclic-di-AMP receptor [Acutalibacteraceae bacterium]